MNLKRSYYWLLRGFETVRPEMTGSAGRRACSTIPGSLASSPRSAILISVFGFCSATTTKYSIDRKLTFLGLTFASTQISLGTLMQFGFSTNLVMVRLIWTMVFHNIVYNLSFVGLPSWVISTCILSYLGTRTVSILQSSWGSRLQSSVGMFWIRSCCSSRQTCIDFFIGDVTMHDTWRSWLGDGFICMTFSAGRNSQFEGAHISLK